MTSKDLDTFINNMCGVSYDGKSKQEIDYIRVFTLCCLAFSAVNAVFRLIEGGSNDKQS